MRCLLPLVAAALVALAGCGQATTSTPNASAPGAGKPQAIPGTHLLLVPPAGFQVSSAFTGLENPDGSKLSVMDITPNNYLRHAGEFTREALEAKGATVLEFQQATISGYPARYANLKTADGEQVCQFMFGDSTFAALAIGELAAGHEQQDGAALKRAVLASRYDKNLKTDPLANAPFQLDISHSPFRFYKAVGGLYVYSLGGEDSPDNSAPVLTVTPLPSDEASTPEAMKDIVLESMERNGMTDIKLRNASTTKVSGYDAYEMDVYCLVKGKPGVFYELFIVGNGKAITVQGIVPASNAAAVPASLQQVKALARTITLR